MEALIFFIVVCAVFYVLKFVLKATRTLILLGISAVIAVYLLRMFSGMM